MTVVRSLALACPAALLLVLPAAAQDTTATAPTPVARIVLGTPHASVAVGDSNRLEGRALDAAGRPIPEATIVFHTVGPAQAVFGEDGWVRAGSVGDVPFLATATVPGTKPYIERLSVRVVPGPARRVVIDPVPARLVPRQRIQLAARAMSADGDARGAAEFTEGVTAGVHSAFIATQPKYGTHIYLTNDGTGALHIIDINDPAHPKEVARWKTARADYGRSLHDIDVQDGLVYASWWHDGMVILDVGNGVKGGSPSNPQLVSQFRYDLDSLYRQVSETGGPGFIRGTHTAWRYRNYVFVADEVFGVDAGDALFKGQPSRAYGRLHVLDVSDLTKPKEVAWYEPEYGGVHNVWVAGDTLYMGAYNAGFMAFDVSRELRGNLRSQGRVMAQLNPTDPQGFLPNSPMTWGVVVKNNLAYVNDFNNGLFIVRLEPRREDLAPPVP